MVSVGFPATPFPPGADLEAGSLSFTLAGPVPSEGDRY